MIELGDHSIANVEVQKIGYRFPGQRSACYSADLLLRQYKRLRDERKKKFSYREIQKVYTLIFFEKSTPEFHAFPNEYLHYFKQKSNTGLKLELLQEYCFIPLDIFHQIIQNRGIKTKLDAWLTFLTADDPETILELTQAFPEFRQMYQDIYELCLNIEGVMDMFSKELQELDRNTVQLMIDEMQNELDHRGAQLEEKDIQLTEQKNQISAKDAQLEYWQQTNQLYSLLANDNRSEDLKRALTDEAFRNELLKEYELNIG